jgi:serine/threonine protein kinase
MHLELDGEKARKRFIAEVEAVRRVAPFCTAQVLDADLDEERPYIVSEYIDGPSLREDIATSGPRSGGSLDRVAVATATALAAIHEAGVVHRDFKPGNVLLGPDGPRDRLRHLPAPGQDGDRDADARRHACVHLSRAAQRRKGESRGRHVRLGAHGRLHRERTPRIQR